jgi:ribosome-binding factor A
MSQQHRMPMISREFLREISRIVNYEMRDPRLKMVTITKVEPAPDLKTAKVYFSVMGDDKARDEARRGLTDGRNFIRSQLRASMRGVRYIPELSFRFDESIAGSVRISKLIDRVAKERVEREESPDAGAEGAD